MRYRYHPSYFEVEKAKKGDVSWKAKVVAAKSPEPEASIDRRSIISDV